MLRCDRTKIMQPSHDGMGMELCCLCSPQSHHQKGVKRLPNGPSENSLVSFAFRIFGKAV